MKTSKLTLLIIPLLFFACKKDPPIPEPSEPVMPPLTHQGLNTFGCYIDFASAGASAEQGGELFVAGGGDSYWDLPPINGSFDEGSKKLIIRATKYTKTESDVSEYIDFRVFLTDELGEYNFWYNEEYGSDGYTNWGGEM